MADVLSKVVGITLPDKPVSTYPTFGASRSDNNVPVSGSLEQTRPPHLRCRCWREERRIPIHLRAS